MAYLDVLAVDLETLNQYGKAFNTRLTSTGTFSGKKN